jgi:hypothetical protein
MSNKNNVPASNTATKPTSAVASGNKTTPVSSNTSNITDSNAS